MYSIKGAVRGEEGVRNYRYTIHLELSLRELFRVYEMAGGVVPHAEAELNGLGDRCLTDSSMPNHLQKSRLHTIRRAIELHRFVQREAGLQDLKLRLLELVLFERTPEARWAAIRGLILEQIDFICDCPAARLPGNSERYKQQLSRRDSALSQLLLTVALFNFDLCAEEPPANVIIRFRKDGFPDHCWEPRGGTPRERSGQVGSWVPEHPLCRWEYLATDLAHTLFGRRAAPGQLTAGTDGGFSSPSQSAEGDAAAARVYCRLDGEGNEQTDQLDLLPTEPETLLSELQRMVHRRHGIQGVRALTALLGRLDQSTVSVPSLFALSEVAGMAFGDLRKGRTRQARINRVRKVLASLEAISCTRVSEQGTGRSVSTTRLVTVLARSAEWPEDTSVGIANPSPGGHQDRPPGPAGKKEGMVADTPPVASAIPPADERVTVLLDDIFYRRDGTTLGAHYTLLPKQLGPESMRHQPLALPVFVHLRRLWATSSGVPRDPCAATASVSGTAERLFRECGLWLRPAKPYRLLEQWKQALNFLRDEGLIGDWRVVKDRRGHLLDSYRIDAPQAVHQQPEMLEDPGFGVPAG